ncbi:hypothetical protein TrVE_jg9909 [Triparma verrucosa]|uniref:HMG box domain-containing protein n=1 Tax=Triparma verrucosa TaxID=1606542 RepID=A0A9W7F5U8_9STRA|nr:hypothetical protein TrVE_jg9909 [Triparma verrucosa]
MLALRFQQKPIVPPSYAPSAVPNAVKDTLIDSCIFELEQGRKYLIDSMGEMLLLCNSSSSRSRSSSPVPSSQASKPLSLEYIADRLDVDDPLYSFVCRTHAKPGLREDAGMLQGFITATTFTNWQSDFRFDSSHESAFMNPPKNDNSVDDGELSRGMQASTKLGDPFNEGIVYPHVAEISLLGGLKCGKQLVALMIDKLEAQRRWEYEYVCLQATENSVGFYERMDFKRIGCIVRDAPAPKEGTSPIVSSINIEYRTEVENETPTTIAQKFNCAVWDILYLNKPLLPTLDKSSKLMASTKIFVPNKPAMDSDAAKDCNSQIKWHSAADDQTPQQIAQIYGVDVEDIVKANAVKFKGLMHWSKLEEGTKLQVSHFDEIPWRQYTHWTFPDDGEEAGNSYMMARKLNRRRNGQKESSDELVATTIRNLKCRRIKVPKHWIPQEDPKEMGVMLGVQKDPKKAALLAPPPPKPPADAPPKPKNPPSAYLLYSIDSRNKMKDLPEFEGKSVVEFSKVIGAQWKALPPEEVEKWTKLAADAKAAYKEEYAAWKEKISKMGLKEEQFKVKSAKKRKAERAAGKIAPCAKGSNLFNKVVCRKGGWEGRSGGVWGSDPIKYWYVLTYLPDLQWCHLAPLREAGVFPADKYKGALAGKTKYMLYSETEGKEVDVSASEVEVVRSKAVRNVPDADAEEWDVYEEGDGPWPRAGSTPTKKAKKAEKEEGGGGSGAPPPKKVRKFYYVPEPEVPDELLVEVNLSEDVRALIKYLVELNTNKAGGAQLFRVDLARLEQMQPALATSLLKVKKYFKSNSPNPSKEILTDILVKGKCLPPPEAALVEISADGGPGVVGVGVEAAVVEEIDTTSGSKPVDSMVVDNLNVVNVPSNEVNNNEPTTLTHINKPVPGTPKSKSPSPRKSPRKCSPSAQQ